MNSDEPLSQVIGDCLHESPDGNSDGNSHSQSGLRCRLNAFSDAMELLSELAQVGLEDIDETLQDTVDQLGILAESVESSLSEFSDDDPELLETVDFVVTSCDAVRKAAFSEPTGELENEQLCFLRDEIEERLSSQDLFGAAEVDGSLAEPWEDQASDPTSDAKDSDVIAPSRDEIAALLSGLSAQVSQDTPAEDAAPQQTLPVGSAASRPAQVHEKDAQANCEKVTTQCVADSEIPFPEADNVDLDDELREAFMDDASHGLESIEQALLDLESSPNDEGAINTIGRALHTIKGASASIGMSNLATYIHSVEELIRITQEEGSAIRPELLLPHADLIRARVEGDVVTERAPMVSTPVSAPALQTPSATNTPPQSVSNPSPKSTSRGESRSDDETVRVKASQLNRLMDMLSELVMLRNQRDTEISELKGIHDELVHSVTRVRMLSHEGEALLSTENLHLAGKNDDGVSFSHLNEVANDVMESAQRLRECYQPVADGNQAVSQFIRNFRLELVQLRRMPVSGLFRRLHRAISDAARTEQKQVRVELLGEDTGIERSLQERIFEPLLHIVRNSVSHGVELPEDRVAGGKPAFGTITLQAHSGPDLLVIEVRDDGGGLDYDAIRRRGIERGLIDTDKSVSRAELARLIFHPGFSTRETASEISGRGVGMDVVASTLERMRGWVEVESEAGSGSTIRLSFPLPSMIQHAMVFESGGQLFALPAQFVRRTGDVDPSITSVDLNQLLSLSTPDVATDVSRRSMIELATGTASVKGNTGDFALLVDRVLGPEEVVVRPMPTMLKSHPLCSGATLSGMGEVVLLLDPRELADASKGAPQIAQPSKTDECVPTKEQARVLVVDDSKSARLRVVRALEKYPVTVVQADDGQAAIELLAKESFVTVFSDIDMPRMSGLELLETIKSEPRLDSIPVVMISSRSIETSGRQAKSIGALEYIQKPLNTDLFDEIVSGLSWANT